MKHISVYFTLLPALLMMAASSCTEVDDVSDYQLHSFPTKITAGDVAELTANSVSINYGTCDGTRVSYYNGSGSYDLTTMSLYVSTEQTIDLANGNNWKSGYSESYYDNGKKYRWKVVDLEPETTYYYCEYVCDYAGQVLQSDWKQFTTLSNMELDVMLYGVTDTQYQFDITVKGFKGTPTRMGMFYGTSSSLTYDNYGDEYHYTITPANEEGTSPWVRYFNINRSGFIYNNMGFYGRAYIYFKGQYYMSPVKYFNP